MDILSPSFYHLHVNSHQCVSELSKFSADSFFQRPVSRVVMMALNLIHLIAKLEFTVGWLIKAGTPGRKLLREFQKNPKMTWIFNIFSYNWSSGRDQFEKLKFPEPFLIFFLCKNWAKVPKLRFIFFLTFRNFSQYWLFSETQIWLYPTRSVITFETVTTHAFLQFLRFR